MPPEARDLMGMPETVCKLRKTNTWTLTLDLKTLIFPFGPLGPLNPRILGPFCYYQF